MSQSLAELGGRAHPVLPDVANRMAKAAIRKADTDDWRSSIGRALQRAIYLRGWSLKEFAGAVDRDERQCSRWIAGIERPQLDVLFSIENFRHPFLQALSEIAGAEVEVTVRLKRTA